MPRACTVCDHPKRKRIDELLVEGKSIRSISRRSHLSKDALTRHRDNHLSKALIAVHEEAEVVRHRSLLERMEELEQLARKHLAEAETHPQKVTAYRELRATVELLGKVTGELREGPQVVLNVLGSEEWSRIQQAIMAALEAHPDARLAVADSLRALKAGT